MMPSSTNENSYSRQNTVQVNKIGSYIRKRGYLSTPTLGNIHTSLGGKNVLHQDLVHFNSFSIKELEQYIESKFNGSDVSLKPIDVTPNDFEEGNKVDNLTKEQLKVKMFETIEQMISQDAILQEEIFPKLVKNCSKQSYIDFYYGLCDTQRLESDDEVEEEQLIDF